MQYQKQQSMSYTYKGTIQSIEDTVFRGEKKFATRKFVVTDHTEKYPQTIQLEFQQDKCDLLDKYRTGSLVNVSFNLRGNQYQGKTYVTLVAWSIESVNNNTTSADSEDQKNEAETYPSSDAADDLPF